MARIPIDREELKRRAKAGDKEAFKALEALEGQPDDPFCHNSGLKCPAVDICGLSQLAKKIAKGKATPEEERAYTLKEGPVFSEYEDITDQKAEAETETSAEGGGDAETSSEGKEEAADAESSSEEGNGSDVAQ